MSHNYATARRALRLSFINAAHCVVRICIPYLVGRHGRFLIHEDNVVRNNRSVCEFQRRVVRRESRSRGKDQRRRTTGKGRRLFRLQRAFNFLRARTGILNHRRHSSEFTEWKRGGWEVTRDRADPEKEDVKGGTCEEMEEQSVSRQKELDEG